MSEDILKISKFFREAIFNLGSLLTGLLGDLITGESFCCNA
jgi:hypothetical protein